MARRDDEFFIKLLLLFATGFVWLIIEFFRSWANARANANPSQRTTYNGADAVHNNCVYIYEIPSLRAVKIGKGHPESRMQAYCELEGCSRAIQACVIGI